MLTAFSSHRTSINFLHMRTSPQRRRYSNERKTSSQNSNYNNRTSQGYNHNTSSLLNMDDDGDVNGIPYNNMVAFEVDHQQQQQQLSVPTNSSLVDSIVHAAQVCNSLAVQYCGLCTVYMDQQVQYELFQRTAASSNAMNNVMNYHSDAMEYEYGDEDRSPQVAAMANAARMLFDEESVVESVSSRS